MIQVGDSAVATILFPSSASTPGSAVVERYAGTYTGGSFFPLSLNPGDSFTGTLFTVALPATLAPDIY
jgi:hypothetical protein